MNPRETLWHLVHSWVQDNTSVARNVPLAKQTVLSPLEQLSPNAFYRTLSLPASRATLLHEILLQASCSLSEQPTLPSFCNLPGECMVLAEEGQVHMRLEVRYAAVWWPSIPSLSCYLPDLCVSDRKAKGARAVLEKSTAKGPHVSTGASLKTCREAQVTSFVLPWEELSVSRTPMLHLSQGVVDI